MGKCLIKIINWLMKTLLFSLTWVSKSKSGSNKTNKGKYKIVYFSKAEIVYWNSYSNYKTLKNQHYCRKAFSGWNMSTRNLDVWDFQKQE
jgi:hypothetical protein